MGGSVPPNRRMHLPVCSCIAITGEVEITVRGSGDDTESKQAGGKHFPTIWKVRNNLRIESCLGCT